MLIAMINESSLVSNDECSTICQALQIQIDRDFLPAWNMKEATIQFFADKNTVPENSCLGSILNNSTEARALGYHSVDQDRPDMFIFAEPILSNGGAVMVYNPADPNQYTVSATISHEVLEYLADPYANQFALGPTIEQGNLYAFESADAVENDSYSISVGSVEVAVSNFILPIWFDQQATEKDAPFDFMKKLTSNFSMDAGGYMIVASITNEGQVMAQAKFSETIPEWRRNSKMKEFSRSGLRSTKK